jgi:hypothetical protein
MGELIDDKQKQWVKTRLLEELLFLLELQLKTAMEMERQFQRAPVSF